MSEHLMQDLHTEEVHEDLTQLLEAAEREKERLEAEVQKLRQQLASQAAPAAGLELSRDMMHELRNLLAVMRNAAFLLKRKVPQQESRWQEYLSAIERAAVSAGEILVELSALGREHTPAEGPRPN